VINLSGRAEGRGVGERIYCILTRETAKQRERERERRVDVSPERNKELEKNVQRQGVIFSIAF
jgi:hypothetical protein